MKTILMYAVLAMTIICLISLLNGCATVQPDTIIVQLTGSETSGG